MKFLQVEAYVNSTVNRTELSQERVLAISKELLEVRIENHVTALTAERIRLAVDDPSAIHLHTHAYGVGLRPEPGRKSYETIAMRTAAALAS